MDTMVKPDLRHNKRCGDHNGEKPVFSSEA